jgi:nucleotide-binding universal stress UspA family protein
VKILIPLDGSDLALDAVHYALRLLHYGLKARFVLATVLDPDGMYELLMVPDAEAREGVNQAVGEQVLASGEALLTAAGVPFEREIRSGYAATMLIEIAEDHRCDAIIIGVHGKGKGVLATALLGSVSQAILHGSSVPVTMVKHADAMNAASSE